MKSRFLSIKVQITFKIPRHKKYKKRVKKERKNTFDIFEKVAKTRLNPA